jgi:integrase
LGNIQARVRAGVWEKPEPPPTLAVPEGGAVRVPTFHEYASWWLQAKVDGVLGKKPLSESTATDYRWRLRCHLLPFFAKYRLDRIDRDLCLAFKAHKLQEAKELREALDAGADMRDRLGRRAVPLSPASMRKLLDCLAGILDEAVEDGHITSNPARGRRMRVHVPKPTRTFLEMDELAALLDAAGEQDVPIGPSEPISEAVGPTAALVAHLLAQGKRSSQIAAELGIAKSTVSFHVGRIGAHVGRGYIGRRVVVEILGRSGVRASELCDMKIGHVRLHDPDGARFHIPDSKTETGVREVQMSPDLVDAVVEHLDRLRRIGAPTGPGDFLVPNLRGGRMDRQRVAKIVGQAAQAATERLGASGLPPLPNTTPHTLRRTYISIALIANNFDVKWVMGQVGHADSKMTMDVYAQLEQRIKRDHGVRFDQLLKQARSALPLTDSSGDCPSFEGRYVQLTLE